MDDINDAIDEVSDEETPEDGAEPDEGEEDGGGMLPDAGGMLNMSGSGKSLDAYENHPYRSLAAGANADVDSDELREKGEKHIARGMDGLLGGLVSAGHPLVDLGIGFVLVTLAGGSTPFSSSDDEDGYDGSQLGNETMDDTPADDLTTGDE